MTQSSPEQMIFKPEVIRLDQEFVLFDPQRTYTKNPLSFDKFQYNEFGSQVQLEIPSLSQIPISIEASGFPLTHKSFGVCPLNPDMGTSITEEDLDLTLRIRKWKKACEEDKLEETKGTLGWHPQAPLSLNIGASMYVLYDQGLCDEVSAPMGVNYVIKPDVFEVLKGIHISLIFPSSFWVGVNECARNAKEGFNFYYFYPQNIGSLAANPEGPWGEGGALHEGVPLFLPAELSEINQIRGKFLQVQSRR